ncbi:unnamed protein product [marine sediment metagenome]|uniref:Uncharacterized protein n=1 Tax=marine sediment metagenome TaxID=412755 RepID=X1GZZ1_9ZZZZ
MSKSICGITLERFIDLLILILFTCIALIYLYLNNIRGTTDLNLHFYIGFGVIIVLGGVITLIFFILKTNWLLNLIGKISIRLRNLVERFLRKFYLYFVKLCGYQ